ncbi:hypothetical protein PAXRUDRAFT_133512 [Paxillus rubicundulus Ve08.2h10]|uniref:Uncharacterized protein n=1 Tax=Paxillus rubicundulus Ve08.2h10 TaxID=930991 RepID=A0A0D0DJT7_9AGAM|nr:hypothetical protein PAXRUDRAFT_133512 [Paxillus rubicundulus Ve08.2h10]
MPSEFPSPGITTKHKVTLKTFCQKSMIPSSGTDKLSLLGHCPGNHIIESLGDRDCKTHFPDETLIASITFLHCLIVSPPCSCSYFLDYH